MSEEEKPKTEEAAAPAPANAPQEESTAEFAPVVRLSFVVVSYRVLFCLVVFREALAQLPLYACDNDTFVTKGNFSGLTSGRFAEQAVRVIPDRASSTRWSLFSFETWSLDGDNKT